MTTYIEIEQQDWETVVKNLPISLAYVVGKALTAAKWSRPYEITILLTGDKAIRDLNFHFRKVDKPTNVLSFPNHTPKELADTTGPIYLGDLALAYETIEREAKEQHKSFANHLIHLVIHGTLHLLGFDHMNDQEAEEMESLEIEILKELDIPNPY